LKRKHRQKKEVMTVQTQARALVNALGPTLTAALAGVSDRATPLLWADGTALPNLAETARIEAADDAFARLAEADGADVARGYFIGMNPNLGDASFVFAIRAGRFDDVRAAVNNIVEGS
jgi:hypothetical protein